MKANTPIRPRAASHILRKTVQTQVRILRLKHRLTQQGLADAAGIDRKTVNRIEMGRFTPNIDTLARLAAAMRIEPTDLLKQPRR